MTFTPFDPLEFKNTKVTEAAIAAVKREIENILSSYVGWYDPFCELIQNALDAVEARAALEKAAGHTVRKSEFSSTWTTIPLRYLTTESVWTKKSLSSSLLPTFHSSPATQEDTKGSAPHMSLTASITCVSRPKFPASRPQAESLAHEIG